MKRQSKPWEKAGEAKLTRVQLRHLEGLGQACFDPLEHAVQVNLPLPCGYEPASPLRDRESIWAWHRGQEGMD